MVEALRWTGYFSFKPLPERASRGRKSCKEKQRYLNSGSCRERGEWWKSICGGGGHTRRRFHSPQSSQFLRISLPGRSCISECLLSPEPHFSISGAGLRQTVKWTESDGTARQNLNVTFWTRLPKRFSVDQRITDLHERNTAEDESGLLAGLKHQVVQQFNYLIIDFDHLKRTALRAFFTLHEMLF